MVLVRNDMRTFSGIAASPGIAMGRLRIIDRSRTVVSEYKIPSERVPMGSCTLIQLCDYDQ